MARIFSNLVAKVKRKLMSARRTNHKVQSTQFNWAAIKKVLKKVILAVLILSICWTSVNIINRQIDQLESLVFSSKGQEGLNDTEINVDFNRNEVFTILFLLEFEQADKSKIDALTIIRFDSSALEATVISFHPNIYFWPSVYGDHTEVGQEEDIVRFKDLMVLGQLQNPPAPLAYTKYQIEHLLALPIDGYIFLDDGLINDLAGIGTGFSPADQLSEDTGYDEWAESLSLYWVDYLNSVSVWSVWAHKEKIPEVKSNLLVPGLYEFIGEFQKVSIDDISLVSVSGDELEEVVNSRGEIVSLVTRKSLDEELSEFTSDKRIDREQARIEIFNGSNVGGLAARYGRLIKHIGGDLIRVENAPGEWEKSVIYVTDPLEFPYTIERVKSLWDYEIKIIEGRPDFVTTGDIIIVLGMDF
ncbi:MAG: LytR C-terminal domain-containing protein [Patescibacteria group bacterium]|nr:LytR C-terminal domain-containing protein [Patescibacteria group bacterium]